MAGGSASPGRSVTSRALAILDAFDETSPRLSLSEIAERSGTPLTTAHRLLAELTDWGALVRRQDGRYQIGPKLWDLGLLAPVQLELRQVAAPFLMDVHTTIRDTVHLAVRDGLSALYVERISGRESVPVVSRVGSRLPLHATGVGKVLLAAAPPDVVDQALRSPARLTRHTLVEPGRLRRELAEVRAYRRGDVARGRVAGGAGPGRAAGRSRRGRRPGHRRPAAPTRPRPPRAGAGGGRSGHRTGAQPRPRVPLTGRIRFHRPRAAPTLAPCAPR